MLGEKTQNWEEKSVFNWKLINLKRKKKAVLQIITIICVTDVQKTLDSSFN